MTIEEIELVPKPPFLFPVRSTGPATWNDSLGGVGPRRLFPTRIAAGAYLTFYVDLRWPSCDVKGYAAGGEASVTDAIVHYRFWGLARTEDVPMGFELQFTGGNQCR